VKPCEKRPRNFPPKRWIFPVGGLAALIWFMIRVIPKPGRAAYPCQRIAAPMASGFLVWLAGLFGLMIFSRRAKRFTHRSNRLLAILTSCVVALTWGIVLTQSPSPRLFADDAPFVPSDSPNQPMGIPAGIHPGRVVWVHDPGATAWTGKGYWWEDSNIDPVVVERMLSEGLRFVTGKTGDTEAWDALFRHFNQAHGKGDVGHQNGEKIAVKLNLNQVNDHGSPRNRHFTSPQLALALLRSLVHNAGVYGGDITFYDVSRPVPGPLFDECRAEFPDVHFVDSSGGDGREKAQRDNAVRMHWSQPLTLEPGGGNPAFLPACVTQAVYVINFASLRGHNLAGITLGAKNHFGTFLADGPNTGSSPMNAGVHPYVCVHDDFHFGGHWDFSKRVMGTYTPLVDLMGHRDLGNKTLLFLVDGLYATPDQSTEMNPNFKWKMAPFLNDWPSSLFLSQDGVAIESVGLDFLRSEPTLTWVRGNVDNYLHEASQAGAPPSGIFYDPEGDGSRLASLGVHEHWNNPTDKNYTRNLGSGEGIELVKLDAASGVERRDPPSSFDMVANYPNPFNGNTTLVFDLERSGTVRICIFDLKGRQVIVLKHGSCPRGRNALIWDGRNDNGAEVPSGLYWASLETGGRVTVQRMTLVR